MLSFMGKTQASNAVTWVIGLDYKCVVKCLIDIICQKNASPSLTHIIVQQDSHFLANVLLQR